MPAPPEMFPWLAERAKLTVGPAFQAIAAIDDSGQIAGMVGYDGWLPNACSMHVAIERPEAVWTLRRPAFELPFLRFGFSCVIAPVISDNEHAIRFDKALGFVEKTRFADAFGKGLDLVFLEMRRDDCRWIRKAVA